MTAVSVEKVNGTPQPEPELGEGRPKPDQEQNTAAPESAPAPAAPSRREEKRRDQHADRAEARADRIEDRKQKRLDAEHQRQLKEKAKLAKIERKRVARVERDKVRARRRKERRTAWQNAQVKLAHHMPLWGLPVVAVSLVMGWSGQAQAASHLGMGWFASGVPVLTEGMTMTTAGLTGQAIEAGRPYKWLLRITWFNAIFAAAVNGFGHLIEDDSAAGMYRAAAYAGASLAGLALFAVVLRSRRAAIAGKTAAEIARWKRLSRRHPFLMRRARRTADSTGVSLSAAWATVWEWANGAKPGEPSIREIRASRRAAFRRREAQSWDGRRGFRWGRGAAVEMIPAVRSDAPESPEGAASERARTPVQPPFLPVALLVPGGQGEWVTHRVPVLPMQSPKASRTQRGRRATTRFPQGKDAISNRVQKDVTDDRLDAVRKLVAEVAAKGADLRKHPSNRATAKVVGCRPGTARELLATVLAERGITRTKDAR
ncbi:hypothetical protein [Streptomyces sp. NPDC059786]|uniref:hypothetical protein n=1 Tax=Streptomyces sp. NPDC059786 TaxID=3346946 RepID=UPI00365CC362